jgi:SAM-dependent methyltransferase
MQVFGEDLPQHAGGEYYMVDEVAARAWDAEYASGRYAGEPPVGFVTDIIAAANRAAIGRGLYVGCGNGRNYIPLTDAGLDLIGLDISATAIAQLAERLPERRDRLIAGDLSALPAGDRFPLVVAIQVLQHGTRAQAHGLLTDSLDRVGLGGLLAVRVNAVGTDIHHAHGVTERHADGSFSIRYLDGPKTGMNIHFWAARELDAAISEAGLIPLLELRPQATWRTAREQGLWLQWEGIYVKDAAAGRRRSAGE